MSEFDEYDLEYRSPREWTEEEMDERFEDLYSSIMDEVKEMFLSNNSCV